MPPKQWLARALCALFVLGIGYALHAALADHPQWLLLGSAALGLVLAGFLRFWARHAHRIAHPLAVALLLALAFALRMAVIRNIPMEPASDYKSFYRMGALLAEDRLLTPEGLDMRHYVAKFPHTIGFPALVLAPTFRLFGTGVRVALYANLALSLGTVLLTYATARRLFGRRKGLVAMAVVTAWPSHVLYANMVASEPAFLFLLMLALYLIAIALKPGAVHRPRLVPALAAMLTAGIILGLANAVRPMALVMLIAACIACLLRREKAAWARGWLLATVAALGFFISAGMAAGGVQGMIQLEPARGLTATGYNWMVGVNAEDQGMWNAEDMAYLDQMYEETGSAEAAHRACMAIAIARMRQNPSETLRLFLLKYRALWRADDFAIDWNLLFLGQQGSLTPALARFLQCLRPLSRALYVLLLCLALFSAASQWRQARPEPIAMLGMLFFIGTALLHMVLETQPRYQYALIPFFVLQILSTKKTLDTAADIPYNNPNFIANKPLRQE